MAAITAFPAIHDVLIEGDNLHSFIAGAAIKAGQVVGFVATGVSKTVHPLNATAGDKPIGVALYDAAIGTYVSVACEGCFVKVANADDTTAIDAGNYVEFNNNAVKGTVSEVAEADIAGAVGTSHFGVVGITLEDIAGGGTGQIMVHPVYVFQKNNA